MYILLFVIVSDQVKPGASARVEREPFKILIVGDSIVKYLHGWGDVTILPKPGKDIQRLSKELKTMGGYLKQFDMIVIHIGTNNIERDSQYAIEREFRFLIWDLRQMLPSVRIGLSCILPRPRDEGNSYIRGKVIRVNNFMIKFAKQNAMVCLRTYSPFLFRGYSIRKMFRDGLHLSPKGLRCLRKFWKDQLGDQILFKRLREFEQGEREEGKRNQKGK